MIDAIRRYASEAIEAKTVNTFAERKAFIEAVREHARGLPKASPSSDSLAMQIARHAWDSKKWPTPT